MKPAKVVFIITGFNTGGAEMVLLALLSRLDRTRFEPVVFGLRKDGPMKERFAALGVPVRGMSLNPALPNPAKFMSLVRATAQESPALVQGWMYHGNLMASLAAKWCGVPAVWSIHNSLYDWKLEKRTTAFVIRLGAKLSRFAKHVVYCAERTARQHESIGYRPDRTLVLPNGFDTERFKPDSEARGALARELSLPEDAVIAGHVSRFHPHKDHATLFAALARAFAADSRIHAVLAGSGLEWSNQALSEMARALPRERVHLLGPRSDVPRLMAGFDLLVSSSASEAFPMVIGEAMACGSPCAVTDVGDSAHLVGECGKVTPPSDPENLAKAVVALSMMSSEARMEMGRRCRSRIVEDFSLSAMVHRWEELFGSALGTQRVGVCAA